MASDLESH